MEGVKLIGYVSGLGAESLGPHLGRLLELLSCPIAQHLGHHSAGSHSFRISLIQSCTLVCIRHLGQRCRNRHLAKWSWSAHKYRRVSDQWRLGAWVRRALKQLSLLFACLATSLRWPVRLSKQQVSCKPSCTSMTRQGQSCMGAISYKTFLHFWDGPFGCFMGEQAASSVPSTSAASSGCRHGGLCGAAWDSAGQI